MGALGYSIRMGWRGVKTFVKQGRVDPLPVRRALKGYTLRSAGRDLKAAVDVALVGLPQGMAFAAMAGLESIYGIMAATVGTFIAPLFTRCSLTVSGPSNATAFMLASFLLAASPAIQSAPGIYVPAIVFLAGLLCVIGAFIKATEMLQFVSRSVLVGYITGAATLIIASQLRYVLGIHDVQAGSSFFSMSSAIIANLEHAQWQPMLLGALSFALFIPLRRYFRFLPTFAVILLLMSLLNWLLSQPFAGGAFAGVRMLRDFTMSDLVCTPPALAEATTHLSEILPIALGVAFLSTLEQTVMSKTISAKTGEPLNLNQDTFAVGMANMGSAFTTSLPCSASLTRSILNYNAGAATRFSGIYCGLLCLGITFVLANVPLISRIPHSVLAALVLANAVSLFDRKLLRICIRSTPGDAAVLVATFVAALLLPLHLAIFAGVVFSVSLFLRKAAKPELIEYTLDDAGTLLQVSDTARRLPQISIVHVEGDLFFGAADLFRKQVSRIAEDASLAVIVLRMRNARNLDATSVCALEELIRFTREQGRHLIISGASREVYRILRKSGVLEVLQEGTRRGESNIFLVEPKNPNMSTRKALLRAQQLLGSTEADISIYTTRSV
ncbi:MAG: SulP family inorganic anion transporter [Akkermansiaceae bacterium]|nr:SulP family inorganic anion transporter [Akkermansiaceae bacterium]